MVAVAFGVAVSALGGTAAGLGIGTYAAIAAGGLLAAYVDQQVTYPALFGKRSIKPDSLEGFQISTSDPGAPRWEVFGTRAWVPSHYLWSLNIREELGGNPGGKGGRPFVQTIRADVGLAVCDGPIRQIETLYADERPFWTRQQNLVVLEDHRWVIQAGTGADVGLLLVQATDADVQDFAGVFAGGEASEFVRLEGVTPTSLNGFYRTVYVGPHSGAIRSTITLRPLQGQVPATGTAGDIFEPAKLRRIDQGAASHEWLGGPSGVLRRPANPDPVHIAFETPSVRNRKWVVGGIYLFLIGNAVVGRFSLKSVSGNYDATNFPPTWLGEWTFQSLPNGGSGGSFPSALGSPSLPLIIVRDDGGNYMFLDSSTTTATQTWVEYLGTQDQPQDPVLSLTEPNPPAHRGVAHVSLGNWNLGPHGNIFPRVTALVRARSGETVAAAISRIWRRTAPASTVDVSQLRAKALLGYSIPGGMTSGQALQPIVAFHGIAQQERGGVMTFLDERDLPVIPVATRHLNARAPEVSTQTIGFDATRVDEADIPQRVQILYVSPTGENEMEGDGDRAPGSSDRGSRDTLQINLRPMVAFGYEVKRRCRQLKRQTRIETRRGQVRLPFGYMDALPSSLMTWVSNNREDEHAAAAATIAHDTAMRDLLPRSVQVRVRFANGQVATLVDDGVGKLEGFPAGVTGIVNTVNYSTGRIELLASVALDTDLPPHIFYRYQKVWLLRANRATLNGYSFGVSCDVVTASRDGPLPPVPRDLPTGLGGAIATAVPDYRVHVLDVPSMFPGQTRSVWIGFAVAAEAGAPWRGATVYQSPNGVDRWSPIGQVQQQATVGTLVTNNLPTRIAGGFHPGEIDWNTELLIDLPGGDTLESVTTAQIASGQNWLLVGDELIGFHEAEAQAGTQWIVRGLCRALRHTIAAMETHVAGERVVLMNSLGIIYHEPVGGMTAAGRDYHFRVVPGGASIDQVVTITTFVRGRSALPAPPLLEQAMVRQRGSTGIDVTWLRRAIDQTVIFGPSPLQAGEFERFEVVAFNVAAAFGLILGGMPLETAVVATATRRWFVGDENMGTPYAVRQVLYTQAEYLAHGYIAGVTPIGFIVWQIGGAGKSDPSDIIFLTPT